MDDEIKARLIKYLDSVESSVEKAVSFTEDQVPLYVQELCHYAIVENIVTVIALSILFVLMVCVYIYIIGKLQRGYNSDTKENDKSSYIFGGCVVSLFAAILMIPVVMEIHGSSLTAYKAAYCPRVYLVEQIKELSQ